MSLDYVKSLTADNEVVEKIYNRIEERLLDKLAGIKAIIVPVELEWIVEEATIKRFNRVGSEGMKSETVEGHSVTYVDGDELEVYQRFIDRYIEEMTPTDRKRGVVYFR